MPTPLRDPRRVLVSDFDGTMTARDFYQVYVDRFMPPDAPDFWSEYTAGRMTHFEALRAIFSYVPVGEAGLLGLTVEMRLDSDLSAAVGRLRDAGWETVVVSAGCRWYIDRLLAGAGVAIEVHGNPGRVDADGRLVLEPPTDSPYFSPETGIDKSAVVRAHLDTGRTVAFAGDGPPDLAPALLVPAGLRFARGHLAGALAERGEAFRPFGRWSDVARMLTDEIPAEDRP